MRKCFSFLLALLLVALSIAACNGTGGEPTTEATSDATVGSLSQSLSASGSAYQSASVAAGATSSELSTSGGNGDEPATPTVLDVITNGTTDYRVIHQTNADSAIASAAYTLTNALNTKYGTALVREEDFVKGAVPDGAREILVGVTNRVISKEMDQTLRANDFVICTRGYSIAILGGSASATAAAVDYFIATYLTEGTSLSLDPALSYRKEGSYTYQSYTLDGTPLRDYRIVVPASMTQLERQALALLQDTVRQQTGVRLATITTSTPLTEHEIRFGKTARHAFSLSTTEYRISRDGGHLNMEFLPACSLAAVRALLADWFATTSTTHTTATRYCNTAAITLSASAAEKAASKNLNTTTQLALADQQNGYITVIDYADIAAACASADNKLWRWQASTSRGNTITAGNNSLDEAKLRYSPTLGNLVLCATASSGGVWVANYSDGACIWEADLSGLGPHSIEYLPCGYVAVACSGNTNTAAGVIRLYDIQTDKYAEVSLTSAHAVVWDPQLDLLWGMGNTTLQGYSVGKDGTGKPTLTAIAEFTYTLPAGGGHDLSFVGGDPTCMWVSGKNVYKFNKTTGVFTKVLEGTGFKSVVSLPDGTVLVTQESNVYKEHDTDTLRVLTPSGSGYTEVARVFNGRAFYKCRIFHYAYCI